VVDLSGVSDFGAIDADADELLDSCFQDHPAFSRAYGNKSFMILGRKGSGKTAIYRRLTTLKAADTFSYGYSFEDYPWHYHELQAETGVPEERRYTHSWKFFILMAICKVLLNRDNSQPWSPAIREDFSALRDFVVDSYGSSDPDVRQLFKPERELHIKASIRAPMLSIGGERLRVKDLPRHVQEVNQVILDHILATLNPSLRYYVCFDQLDIGFSWSELEYSRRLIGLILAARELFLAARNSGKQLNVIVFLRDDIYQGLHFDDKNKITENFTSRVEWSEEGAGLTLASLMESRFTHAIPRGRRGIAWSDVFDSDRMPGRQTKYSYICDRTFLRPRDMIKFCNEVLATHNSRRPSKGARISSACVMDAGPPYSNYLLNELDDEVAKQVPAYQRYLDVIRVIGSDRFLANDFVRKWIEQIRGSQARAEAALERLFVFSVVGYLNPGSRDASEYVWRYKDFRARFNIDAEFRVHPGLKDVLGLRD
jgi:hypothetical protein